MKVKIQYTVDMEDIPSEVDALVKRALIQLSDASTTVGNLKSYGNMSKFLKATEDARSQLVMADMLLGDCYRIITDYATAVHSAEAEEKELEQSEG